ncbi:MAG: hypothetical protein JXA73_06965 [Acidobacteria bacterium]|nr:hypothetical protein [Acidobacteriota bacterium]
MKAIKNILLLLLLCGSVAQCQLFAQGATSANSIEPNFRRLLITYPRKASIVNPMVPRISPQAALSLYKSGKGVFIAAGQGAIQANLPGALSLTEELRLNPSLLKVPKDRLIVLFCH